MNQPTKSTSATIPAGVSGHIIVWSHTPVGALWAQVAGKVQGQGALKSLQWGQPPADVAERALLDTTHPAFDQLNRYFNGQLTAFDLQLMPQGTPFQRKVWRAMRSIPYGTVATYADLAEHVKSGPRAVAGACGANPLPLFIPCHRVVGSNGTLTGYSGAGGGITGIMVKQTLLTLEGVTF